MNRRIAKKVLQENKCCYSFDQQVAAHRRLGMPVPVRPNYAIGVDQGEGPDSSVIVKMKVDFHKRTGQAPSNLPGALPGRVFPIDALEDMFLPELKALAKDKGLKGFSTLNKAELVALIKG